MKKITFQRKQLYEKVWSTPVTQLAKEYGISSHQLYKVCEELDIPTPSTGYWAKVRHGKKVTKAKLPESGKESFTLKVFEQTQSSGDTKKPNKTVTVSKRLTRPLPPS